MNDNVQNGEVIIDINDLSKAFGDLKVLTNISTQIRKGDVVCVIGPSGSGKSTFTNRIKQYFGDDVAFCSYRRSVSCWHNVLYERY